jgi:hypothetical protein
MHVTAFVALLFVSFLEELQLYGFVIVTIVVISTFFDEVHPRDTVSTLRAFLVEAFYC